MGSLKLTTASSGSVILSPANTASDTTITVPAVTDTMTTTTTKIISGTAVTASGSSVDFTGIPSWVKRITVMFSGVSVSGTQNFGIRVGTSGGFVTSGYNGTVFNATGAASSQYSTNNFIQVTISNAAANTWSGTAVLTLLSPDVWTASSLLGMSNTNGAANGAGSIDAGGTVTQIRIMTVSTDTFDAGSINILYE